VYDKSPPHNIEAEQGVIGCALWDHDTLHLTLPVVSPDDFYRDAHGLIWRAVKAVYESDAPVNPTTVCEELTRAGDLKRAGGEDYLAECINSVPHTAHALTFAQLVREKSAVRAILDVHLEGVRQVYAQNANAASLADKAVQSILAAGERAARGGGDLKTLGQAMAKALEVIEARRHGATVGVKTGVPKLDDLLTLTPGSMTVIGARPGAGKSALALNIALHAATKQDTPVLMFSLEMSDAELGERSLSVLGGAGGFQMRHPTGLTSDGLARLMAAAGVGYEAGKDAWVWIDDESDRTSLQVVGIARRAKVRHGIGLVVLDYLQLCEADEPSDTRQEQVSKISRRLKTLARSLDVPVLALSQLNRQCESENRRPRKSDLRESGSLEQDADNVILLYAPNPKPDDTGRTPVEIILDKSRGGPTGVVETMFRPNLMRFEPWVPPPADAAEQPY